MCMSYYYCCLIFIFYTKFTTLMTYIFIIYVVHFLLVFTFVLYITLKYVISTILKTLIIIVNIIILIPPLITIETKLPKTYKIKLYSQLVKYMQGILITTNLSIMPKYVLFDLIVLLIVIKFKIDISSILRPIAYIKA